MFHASFKHTNRHKAVLTKDERNILDLIRFYTAWDGAANLTYELLKSTGRCLFTIHCAIRKLIKIGIISKCYSEIDGIPTVLYTMQPFEEDSEHRQGSAEPFNEKGTRFRNNPEFIEDLVLEVTELEYSSNLAQSLNQLR